MRKKGAERGSLGNEEKKIGLVNFQRNHGGKRIGRK